MPFQFHRQLLHLPITIIISILINYFMKSALNDYKKRKKNKMTKQEEYVK